MQPLPPQRPTPPAQANAPAPAPAPSPTAPTSEADLGRVIEMMLDMGYTQDEIEEVRRKMQNAQQSTAPAPSGRYAGGTFVAANPLEFLGAGIRNVRAGRAAKRYGEEEKKLRNDARAKLGSITGYLSGSGGSE